MNTPCPGPAAGDGIAETPAEPVPPRAPAGPVPAGLIAQDDPPAEPDDEYEPV